MVWQLFLEIFHVDPFIGRGPRDVWDYLTTGPVGADARDQLWDASVTTLTDAGLGLVAGASVAVLVALVFNLSPSAEQTFMPLAMVLRSVPLVAMTPLIALIFGRGLLAVTIIAGIVTFFPSLVNVTLALAERRPRRRSTCARRTARARSRRCARCRCPTALPALFASLRIAAPLALVGALLAEWLRPARGSATSCCSRSTLSNYNMLWSATVLVTIYSIVVYSIIAAIEKVMLAKYSDPRG